MTFPALPPETILGVSEREIGQWDFPLQLRQSPVARIVTRFLLTDERLIVLQLPTARNGSKLAGLLSRSKPASSFTQEMGRWHVMLNSRLKDLPEPTLGRVRFSGPSALPSNRALVVGARNFPVGEDPGAEAMATRVRAQWVGAQDSRLPR